MAQAKYSALDLRGSPGFEPKRSVGVSPMPTIAALFVMLIVDPVRFSRTIGQRTFHFKGNLARLDSRAEQ
jgi:hypothetical protein